MGFRDSLAWCALTWLKVSARGLWHIVPNRRENTSATGNWTICWPKLFIYCYDWVETIRITISNRRWWFKRKITFFKKEILCTEVNSILSPVALAKNCVIFPFTQCCFCFFLTSSDKHLLYCRRTTISQTTECTRSQSQQREPQASSTVSLYIQPG